MGHWAEHLATNAGLKSVCTSHFFLLFPLLTCVSLGRTEQYWGLHLPLSSKPQFRRRFHSVPTEQGHILLQNKVPKHSLMKTWLVPSIPLLVGCLAGKSAVFLKVNLKSWDLRGQSSVYCSARLFLRLWASLPFLCFAPQLQNQDLSCSSFLSWILLYSLLSILKYSSLGNILTLLPVAR